jgi:hypothetical protein
LLKDFVSRQNDLVGLTEELVPNVAFADRSETVTCDSGDPKYQLMRLDDQLSGKTNGLITGAHILMKMHEDIVYRYIGSMTVSQFAPTS